MNFSPEILLILKTVAGVAATLVTGLITYLVKNYFDSIRTAIVENQKDSKEKFKVLLERQRKMEIAVTSMNENVKELIKDVARIQGYQDNMQNQISDVVAKVEKATGRLDAAFRFIDGANKRATDMR